MDRSYVRHKPGINFTRKRKVTNQANEYSQNLLPLLLRPLRLFLSGETLRSIRIILLKATHWPFVALILGYESGRLYLERRRKNNSSLLYVQGPNSPKTLRRPLWKQKPMLATDNRHARLAGEARPALTSFATPALAPVETRDSLEAAVNNLKTQIETISAIIAKEQLSTTPA